VWDAPHRRRDQRQLLGTVQRLGLEGGFRLEPPVAGQGPGRGRQGAGERSAASAGDLWSSPADAGDPAKTSRVTFEIDELGGKVRLKVTHTNLDPKAFTDVSGGWPRCSPT
jgi:hypothetical protein